VVAYADTAAGSSAPIELFEIEQLVAPGEVAARPLLPSLRYHPARGELVDRDIQLPWPQQDPGGVELVVLGELARELGSKVPGRLVVSAKSWLSHPNVDRAAPILPWGGADDVPKVSPVEASASYLAHMRAAWNHCFSGYSLEKQDVVLTVPASFDEVARRLTVEAARLAGLPAVRLLEEPQAACYDWLYRHQERLEEALGEARLLLVCDVGGGTTDLTLVQVKTAEDGLRFSRIGVGDHLMLGGDNMDLTLAHHLEQRLGNRSGRLSTASLSQLVQQCRSAKERLLAPAAPERTTVTVLGTGGRLIGDSRSAELTRDEVQEWLVDGFFPAVRVDERPQARRGGIVEFGLPYAADPAVTRHLARFLARYAEVARQALEECAPTGNAVPDAVLLNGGVFHSSVFTRRLLEVLASWRGAPLRQLRNAQPDLAVARGAVAYGMARRGHGPRIGGGSARSHFLVIDSDSGRRRGVCLLPRGTEEDHEIRLTERSFSLRLGQPVRFHLVTSTADTPYQAGDLVDLDVGSFTTLPPVATVMKSAEGAGDIVVELAAVLTEVGTLEVDCVAKDDPAKRWALAFELRGEAEETRSVSVHPRFRDAAELIDRFYGPRAKEIAHKEIKTLRTELERILGKRDNWDIPLLRALFSLLWNGGRRRRRSADHERLWLSLTGYCLRPGFGYPLDDWRVQQLESLYDQGVQYHHEAQVWSEWWTLWRRIAGGLHQAAQERILEDIVPALIPLATKAEKVAKTSRKQGIEDMIRLIASLERLPVRRKVELGEILLRRLQARGESAQTWWAVGRLGARVPFHGSIHNVVPRAVAAEWLAQALKPDWRAVQPAAFAATLLARLSGDRERDLEEDIRARVVKRLQAAKAPASWIAMVSEVVELDEADEKRMFGEALPPGLKLV
jgi:molecular chaperone DnaK (HSP70)